MKRILILFALPCILFACKKDSLKKPGNIEIYTFKTLELIDGKCQVNAAGSMLENIPVVRNQDIIEYSKNDHEFTLADDAIQQIKTFSDRTAFAVTVNKQVIYSGFFKPAISSSSCIHSITMDSSWAKENTVLLSLGYPGPVDGTVIDDQRNNARLLAALREQGKLR